MVASKGRDMSRQSRETRLTRSAVIVWCDALNGHGFSIKWNFITQKHLVLEFF